MPFEKARLIVVTLSDYSAAALAQKVAEEKNRRDDFEADVDYVYDSDSRTFCAFLEFVVYGDS
jgi:hypothetical protein